MNHVEIRYSYFSQRAELNINGEGISQYSDLTTILGRPFLEAVLHIIHELDEHEIGEDYEVDLYSTVFQYELLSSTAKESKYCRAIHFHELDSLFEHDVIIERLDKISAQHGIRIDRKPPFMVYNAAGVNIPQVSVFSCTDTPNADIGIYEDLESIPSTIRTPILLANSFDVSLKSGRTCYCIPTDRISSFWDYYEMDFFIIPLIAEYLTALKYVKLSDAENIEINAMKESKPAYYISDVPISMDQGDSLDVEFSSFPSRLYSLRCADPDIISYKDGKIIANNPGATSLLVVDEKGELITSKPITIIGHLYAKEIRLIPRFEYLRRNERGQIDVIITPPNAEDANQLTWSISDPNVVQVNESGNIIALEDGEATITVSGHNISSILTVKIKPTLQSLRFSQQSVRVKGGETVILNCDVTPSDAPTENLVWELDNRIIASINPSLDGRRCQVRGSSTYEGKGNVRCYDPITKIAAICNIEVLIRVKHSAAGKTALICLLLGIIMPFLLPVSTIASIYGITSDQDPDHRPRYIWCAILSVIIILMWFSHMR